MKRILVPTKSGADWRRLLARPEVHWKSGASAMTAAASWEAANGALPQEISLLLDSSGRGELSELRLLAAVPEWEVELEGGATPSHTDVLAICCNNSGLCIIAVEAKVLEDFGPTLGEKRRAASEGQINRLHYLLRLLGVENFEDGVRYQLIHRTASALLTAKDFHGASAVMLVHAFGTPADRRKEFEEFAAAMRAKQIGRGIYAVPRLEKPTLYLAWCDGDARFLKAELPTSA